MTVQPAPPKVRLEISCRMPILRQKIGNKRAAFTAMSDSPDNTVDPAAENDTVQDPEVEDPKTEKTEVAQLVDRLIRAKRITYTQYQTLSKMVLADGTVDEQERRQINRLFDAIQAGAIRIME